MFREGGNQTQALELKRDTLTDLPYGLEITTARLDVFVKRRLLGLDRHPRGIQSFSGLTLTIPGHKEGPSAILSGAATLSQAHLNTSFKPEPITRNVPSLRSPWPARSVAGVVNGVQFWSWRRR